MSFNIIRADITKISADAIVNSAHNDPIYSHGTDKAIYIAAGKEALLEARKKIGKIEEGDVCYTEAYNLNAKYIIHTVVPRWSGNNINKENVIKNCYIKCLELAKSLGCNSIAFPLLGTSLNGFPKSEILQIVNTVCKDFLSTNDMEILLVVFDQESFVISKKIFPDIRSYIDSNEVQELWAKEYSLPAPLYEHVVNNERKRLKNSIFAASESKINFDKAKPNSILKVTDEKYLLVGETFQEMLFRYINDRHFTDVEVYKRANLDRKLFSKIRNKTNYKPSKDTVISLGLALHLNVREMSDFLESAGYALTTSNLKDLVIMYYIENKNYDIYTINIVLFENGIPPIGSQNSYT